MFPDRASHFAGHVDALYAFLIAITVFFSVLIFSLVLIFAVRYRRRSPDQVARPLKEHPALEAAWIIVPLVITMILFYWGAWLYFRMAKPPQDSLEVFVVGKQWMWKLQHPNGKREINELHVPVGQPVTVTLTSEDVIHSFFVPAFRVKMDAVPGRYSKLWFKATKTGTYHLFCAEYCGTKHSGMIGWVHVMEPSDYAAWLSGTPGAAEPPAVRGQKVFERLRCDTCHAPGSLVRAPLLDGLYGSRVRLQGGRTVEAFESYLRESILEPHKKIVEGYDPVMPTYTGQITEEEIYAVISYIKSLKPKEGENAGQGQLP